MLRMRKQKAGLKCERVASEIVCPTWFVLVNCFEIVRKKQTNCWHWSERECRPKGGAREDVRSRKRRRKVPRRSREPQRTFLLGRQQAAAGPPIL